jgi:RimJ/RimL family protein N-acetyltransferase
VREPVLSLRPATHADQAFYLEVRNDPDAVRWSRSGRPIDPAMHAAWFAWAVCHPGHVLFVAEDAEGQAIGTGRLTLGPGGTECSLAIAPAWRGQGYGRALVQALVVEARRRGLGPVWAEIRPGNLASLRAFLAAGFDGPPIRLERQA